MRGSRWLVTTVYSEYFRRLVEEIHCYNPAPSSYQDRIRPSEREIKPVKHTNLPSIIFFSPSCKFHLSTWPYFAVSACCHVF